MAWPSRACATTRFVDAPRRVLGPRDRGRIHEVQWHDRSLRRAAAVLARTATRPATDRPAGNGTVGWPWHRRRARGRVGQRRASRPGRVERRTSQCNVDDSQRRYRRTQARTAPTTQPRGLCNRDQGCRVVRDQPRLQLIQEQCAVNPRVPMGAPHAPVSRIHGPRRRRIPCLVRAQLRAWTDAQRCLHPATRLQRRGPGSMAAGRPSGRPLA